VIAPKADIPVLKLPPLYPIIDFAHFAVEPDPVSAVVRFAEELLGAGATLIQLRDKSEALSPNDGPRRFLSCARELRRVTLGRAALIINDRVDLCLASGADGVHLGQDDLSPAAARRIFDSVVSHPISQSLEKTQLLRESMGHPGASSEIVESHPFSQSLDKTQLLRERMGQPAGSRQHLLIGYSTHNLDQVREADSLPVDYLAIGPVFATASKAKADPVVGLEGVRAARRVTKKPLVAIGGITRLNCAQVKDSGADSVAVISDLFDSSGKAVADFLRILG
jgi:thiamine monophosphate synthase